MTKEEIAELVKLYNEIMDYGVKADAEALLKDYPNLLNYDEAGNYVGPVSNENGWTP
jgi:hypothetical protein